MHQHPMRRLGRRVERRDETGSVMIAVVIIAILSMLAVTVFSSVNTGLSSARTDEDRTDAFQWANAGIDQALYRLDRSDLPTTPSGTYMPTVSGGVVTSFTEQFTEGGHRFQITATPSPAGQNARWTIRAVGTDLSGRRRQAVATAEAQLLFEDGFFTFEYTDVNGNPSFPDAYDSSVDRTASTPLAAPYDTSIGTNDFIDLVPPAAADWNTKWRSYNMYGRPTIDDAIAACGGCLTSKVRNFAEVKAPIVMPIPTGPPPAGAVSCPNGGTITGPSIAPGNYTCPVLRITGDVYVTGTGIARFWPTERFIVEGGVTVNGSPDGLGDIPSRFQVFYYDPRVHNPSLTAAQAQTMIDASGICSGQNTIFGLLYAPVLTISNANGCGGANQPVLYGAVALNIYRSAGAPLFEFHWDADSTFAVHTGKYRIFDWRECPPDAPMGTC